MIESGFFVDTQNLRVNALEEEEQATASPALEMRLQQMAGGWVNLRNSQDSGISPQHSQPIRARASRAISH
jgi:hypothetical protein